ncbi:F0F1 ATP synthase subunit epsilon [Tessaracoccus massiliensis]|uniref:F0F1 ATP synthase subunit epsilon n=1 Tax=Tessaracoccus massiliensis TaxID=1522311 RepID=UPI00058DC83A|nr:F0F1 ATP synthase subunit epsilon [Tessaracoccus massiliensis]
MDRSPLHVEVVSADRVVWSGDAVNIIARTVEGDIGILPGHEPLLAVLQPSMVEIVTAEGTSESLMVDGGFISVAHDHVSLLAQFAELGKEVSLEEAQKELAPLVQKAQQGHADDAEIHRLKMLKAQVRAGERAASN